jgi:uncharacterized membrane protein
MKKPVSHVRKLLESQKLLIITFFSIIGSSLLVPIASNHFLPSAPDYANHVALIIQAKMAILEGQFPIRVTPWQFNGWRYPCFQFYSPLVYTFAGLVYCIISNPYVAFKITIWLASTVAGIYTYRSARLLSCSHGASLLAGVAYMMAPYFLININARGAFTEAIAQGVLPVVLFYALRLYLEGARFRTVALASVSWFVLLTTHLITFVYASFFIGLFFLLLILQNKNRKSLKRSLWLDFMKNSHRRIPAAQTAGPIH